MKRKTILLLICIVIILCLTGCGAHTEISSADDSVSNSATDDAVSIETITEISETETSETTSIPTPDTEQSLPSEKETTPKAETTNSETETAVPAETHVPSSDSKTKTETPKAGSTETTPKPSQPTPGATKPTETSRETEKPTEQPKETVPPESVETNPPATAPPATEPPETPPPAETEAPAFDIDYWVSYARNYAVSVGLNLESSATDCWDNPIVAGAHCKYLARDIEACLNRYSRDEDITDVWIWVVPTGNNCYDLMIGYA